MKYPDDCIQSLMSADSWWEKNEDKQICRGALVTCFVPHVDQVPYTFNVVGRTKATEHSRADVQVAPLSADHVAKQAQLPVAAMPLHRGEVWAAYRAKARPCLVLSYNAERSSDAESQVVGPTMLVAPYYGVGALEKIGSTGKFIERVRHCEYPNLMWDVLPSDSGMEQSILRLDLLQPVGSASSSYKVSEYSLSADALNVVDGLLNWTIWGALPANHTLKLFRDLMRSEFPD